MPRFFGLTAMLGLAASPLTFAGAAAISTEVPVFQGAVNVTKVNAACQSAGYDVGSWFTAIFRSEVRPSNGRGGGLTLLGTRTTYVYIVAGNKALPPGRTTGSFDGVGTSSQVGAFTFSSAFDLRVSPSKITAKTDTVEIEGTIEDFNAEPGCAVTIRGAFSLRP